MSSNIPHKESAKSGGGSKGGKGPSHGGNKPSTTGKPSGKGRSNNPSK